MIPGAESWSKERINQEIRNRESELAENREAVDFHKEQYRRVPSQGYQGSIAENNVTSLKQEIRYLKSLL